MCGIYGITEHNTEFINKYIEICKHRGPDGQNVWSDGKVTLGHNLLSIMGDPKESIQPWNTPHGNILVYNGEIFNYYELKKKYASEGFSASTGTDTELLAWGLDKYGSKFIEEIDSMHGFAYYRIKEQELWLSRDHAGIKPVFYAHIDTGIVFGSEIKGLLDKVPGSRQLDNLALSFMGKTGINALRNTFFKGVKKLLAGETIIYDVAGKRIKHTHRQYIRPENKISFTKMGLRSVAREAVEMCSIGRRKIGVFLSGGLDSSVVAYELMKVKGEVNSFTNRMNPHVNIGEDYNSDANCARILAESNGFNHTEVEITPDNYIDAWEDSIYYMEQPVYNPSMAMYCHTNKFLADKDIVVTMAGDMGDEVLAGYPKYWKMKNPEWLQKQIQKDTIETWDDVLALWLKRIKRPLHLTDNPLPEHTLLKEFKKCYGEELWNSADPIGSYMALDCMAQVPEEMFNRNDKYGMAYGMEGRFPLATKKFMKYCMSIHSDFKMGDDKKDTKILFKRAYADYLPAAIIGKDKTGWTVPVGHWLTANMSQDLRKFYSDAMQNKSQFNVISASQKAGKALIPAWIVRDWIKCYNMEY